MYLHRHCRIAYYVAPSILYPPRVCFFFFGHNKPVTHVCESLENFHYREVCWAMACLDSGYELSYGVVDGVNCRRFTRSSTLSIHGDNTNISPEHFKVTHTIGYLIFWLFCIITKRQADLQVQTYIHSVFKLHCF